MTHIENIPHILQNGITHAASDLANPNFKPIGDASLISTRSNYVLKNGRLLGEYIPFYFSSRTPMLYVIQKGFNGLPSIAAEHIVYCVSSVQKVLDYQLDFVFTDGHAVDGFSQQYDQHQLNQILEALDWSAIQAKYWKSETDLDLKRRKEAEFLVSGDLPYEAVLGFIVATPMAKDQLLEWGVIEGKVIVKSDYYF